MGALRKSILVVDDNVVSMQAMLHTLQEEFTVYPAVSGGQAFVLLKKTQPDLILLDVRMPDMDGYQVMERLKLDPLWAQIPVIFLTSMENRESEEHALAMGAVDYITKPVVASILMQRVRLHLELEGYRKNLEGVVEKKTKQLLMAQDAILDILANVTSFRDNETGAHIRRTTGYVRVLVEALQELDVPGCRLDAGYAEHIVKSAKLHDIGKVAIADSILLKPDRLTPDEYERIKSHTTFGAMVVGDAIRELGEESGFLAVAQELIYTHHECWDGSGYPQGLKGEEIPLSGRIMAIADVYDALISHRPYKGPFTHGNAMFIIRSAAGTQFDPNILEHCPDVFERFAEIAQSTGNEEERDFRAW